MPYTSIEQVRHHLPLPSALSEKISDFAVTLAADDYVPFHHGAVETDSVVVKSVHAGGPIRLIVTPENGRVFFSEVPVVARSVVVASDSSLGTVYSENVDYVVDYAEGQLTLKNNGGLSNGVPVTIWYLPYTTYTGGIDYQLREDRGEIKRLPSGSIAPGETVFLEFRPVFLSLTDEIIAHAVAQANRMVENEVDVEAQFEADPMLSAAATFRALETVCRAAAAQELAGSRSRDKTAAAWMKLADDYAGRSEQLIKSFRPPFDSPRSPATS